MLLALAMVVLICLAVPPVFDTCDDTLMMFISSGLLHGRPDVALIYTHHWLGYVLTVLYKAFPALNWYIIYQYLLLVLSLGVSIHLIRRAWPGTGLAVLLLTTLVSLAFYSHALLQLQYTGTAFMVGFTAFLCLLSWAKSRSVKQLFGFFILFTLAAMVRFQAISGLLALLLPLLLYQAIQSGSLLVVAMVALALIPIGLVRWADSAYYAHSRNHPEVFEYQANINTLVNGPHKPLNQVLLENGRESAAAYTLIKSWFWIDSQYLGISDFKRLAKDQDQARSLQAGFVYLLEVLYSKKKLLLIFFLFIILAGHIRSVELWLLLGTLGVICIGLSYTSRLPDRVLLPLLTMFSFARLYIIPIRLPQKRFVTVSLVAAILLLNGLGLWLMAPENKLIRQEYHTSANWLRSGAPEVVVVRGNSFPYEGAFSWYTQETASQVLLTGWLLHTPAYQAFTQKHLAGRDVWQQLQKEGIYCTDPPVAALREYARELYGVELAFEALPSPLSRYGTPIPIYSIHTTQPQ